MATFVRSFPLSPDKVNVSTCCPFSFVEDSNLNTPVLGRLVFAHKSDSAIPFLSCSVVPTRYESCQFHFSAPGVAAVKSVYFKPLGRVSVMVTVSALGCLIRSLNQITVPLGVPVSIVTVLSAKSFTSLLTSLRNSESFGFSGSGFSYSESLYLLFAPISP